MASARSNRYTVTFGQYEPLTKRLHNLLKEYRDGFSVPKELIQNADDAGATRVSFLYDCRENTDARTNLVEDGLAEFQGPALWAYNNEIFTDADFQNIRKLGGATKEEDTTKVGKFGLGFNSVYNITDLPNFISGNRAVIFDPHSTHLGELGRSTDLKREENVEIVQRWNNQLKPYDGIFGCNLTSRGQVCNGTLFRFPLRTKNQAKRSEIKDLSYTEPQMKEFYKVFAKYAGNLLTFTQNVQCVTFFYLPKSGKPREAIQLVDVRKHVLRKQLVFPDSKIEMRPPNILEYSSKALSSGSIQDDLKYIDEQIDIEATFLNHPFNKSCSVKEETNSLRWNVTWSMGNEEAIDYADASPLKGLVPLAAVAIPLETGPRDTEELCCLSRCGSGFYPNGHLFCFMPLPITTGYSVHINATFATSSDRRHLCVQSSDDTDATEAEWNKILWTKVIRQAWAYGLENLMQTGSLKEQEFYSLWPRRSPNEFEKDIVSSFYRFVINNNVKIFFGENCKKWCSYEDIILLDPKLRHDGNVGDIALSTFKRYIKHLNMTVVDLPSFILDDLSSCHPDINQKIVTEKTFFERIFFPSIPDEFLADDERNKLTQYALLSTSSEVRQLVTKYQCIPTQPNGVLKKVNDIVHPKGQTAALFLREEGVFPVDMFCGHAELTVLEDLGMKVDELTSQQILERASYIQETRRLSLTRSFLKYLGWTSTQRGEYKRFELHQSIQSKLNAAVILPVLKKPSDWPFAWKGKADMLAAPNSVYDTNVTNLVACSESILDKESLGIIGSEFLIWLGVKTKDDVEIKTVLFQLQCLCSTRGLRKNRQLSDICHSVYKFLEKKCALRRKTEYIKDSLQSYPSILTQQGFIAPQNIAMNLLVPLKPYLYQVEEEFCQCYPKLLKVIGIKDYFTATDICTVMNAITKGLKGGPLTGESLKCFCKTVQVLVDAMERDRERVTGVKLPNIHGHLYDANDLCLNDCEWIHEQKKMRFLHPNITPKDGRALGVKTKREASLDGHISPIPFSTAFGQHETLTSRLKRILDGYPKDVAILKELLQNADDAGASELMFIKDFRQHETKRLFGEEWKHLQGPALCVFNDSHFTEGDFDGIQSLGQGSKSHDPLKTGQYGVGFNVVYHLTDVPSLITVGPSTERTLCVLDPHQMYAPRTNSPGIRFNNLDEIRDTYKDVFSCYHEDTIMKRQEGTLFRFPLRTEAMANESKISRHATTTDEVIKMLEKFKKEVWSSVLFLTSVRKVTIASVKANGKLSIEYSIETFMSRDDEMELDTYLSRLKTLFPNPDLQRITQEKVNIVKKIKDSSNTTKEWLIVHQVGLMSSVPIPDDILYYWGNGEIQLLPRGGVAIPMNPNHHVDGKLFCVLPLPKKTGLPVHVNGHFALGHEARRDLWHGTNDYREQWNNLIIEAVICPSYIAALIELQNYFPQTCSQKRMCETIDSYYKRFPIMDGIIDPYVKHLVKAFYNTVAEQTKALFPVVLPQSGLFLQEQQVDKRKVAWVPVANDIGVCGYFNTFPSVNTVSHTNTFNWFGIFPKRKQDAGSDNQGENARLEWLLKDLGMKIIEPSESILSQFEMSNFKDKVYTTSPKHVTGFLKTSHENADGGCYLGNRPELVSNTLFKTVENVKLLTKFCKMSGNFESSVIGLPLKVTQSNLLSRFTENDVSFVSHYADLLPMSVEMFIHKDLVSLYVELELQKTGCLKGMSVFDFSNLLEDNLDSSHFKSGKHIPWKDEPNELWICRLWEFLSSEVNAQFKIRQTEEPLKDSEELKEKVAKDILLPLMEWSLIPAYIQTDKDYHQCFLYPLNESNYIISLQNLLPGQMEKILKKIDIPKLKTSVFYHDKRLYGDGLQLCCSLVTDTRDPGNMLDALSKTTAQVSKLTSVECCEILHYFDGQMEILRSQTQNLSSKLSRFSYFPSLTGNSVSLEKWSQIHVVIDNHPYIPHDGLGYLCSELRLVLIVYKEYYKNILNFLNLTNLSQKRTYAVFIIPNLMKLQQADRMKHLLYIRDNIFGQYWFYPSDEQREVAETLRHIPFIVTSDGKQHCASEFYSSKITEFRLMCHSSAFLPAPFDDDQWQPLLDQIGLKCQISIEDFVHFAKNLETESVHGITSQVKEKSQLLVAHLHKRQDATKERLWFVIRDIRFVLPFDIEHETKDGPYLKDIHDQYENAKRLVAYSECCNPTFYHHIWTSCSMWSRDAHPCKNMTRKEAKEVLDQLRIGNEPSVEDCIIHLQNICHSLKGRDVVYRKKHQKFLESVFTDIYDFLQKHMPNNTITRNLFNSPVVFIVEHCELVPATDVVVELHSSENIPGYTFKASNFFGRFFSLFEQLGAQKTVSANTYAVVLTKIFQRTQGSILDVNELKSVEKTMRNFVKCISRREEETIETDMLYLPSEDGLLMSSTLLVVKDRVDLASRLQALPFKFLMEYENLEIPFNRFPEKFKLLLLSSTVEEKLSPRCSELVYVRGSAYSYEQKIKSSDFVNGILRICNHQSNCFTKVDAETIQNKIARIKIIQIQDLETILVFKGEIIEGSNERKEYFTTMIDQSETDCTDGECAVYISTSSQAEKIHLQIAFVINSLTNHKLGQYTTLVEKMISREPETIVALLDENRIKKYSGVQKPSTIVYPKAGTLVSEEFHYMLDNTFFLFEVGEYIGLDLYDPFADGDNADGTSLAVYVYAIIVKIEDDSSPMTARYLVQIDEDVCKSFSATMLYKFHRETTDKNTDLVQRHGSLDLTSSDIESILCNIRQQLQGAWDSLTVRERNRVRLRLLTLWHPDRNNDKVELCTKVCQYISLYVERLDKGESLENCGLMRHTFDVSFFNEVSRRSNIQKRYHQKSKFPSSLSCHQASRRTAYPHFGEALRWFKQAKVDLEAAASSMNSTNPEPHNWSCYKSHQAAEKALKAVLYTVDSHKADDMKIHNICEMASGLGFELQQLASELNSRVGNYNGLRYPDRSTYPQIPSDMYSRSDAQRCFELAKDIVAFASRKVQRKEE